MLGVFFWWCWPFATCLCGFRCDVCYFPDIRTRSGLCCGSFDPLHRSMPRSQEEGTQVFLLFFRNAGRMNLPRAAVSCRVSLLMHNFYAPYVLQVSIGSLCALGCVPSVFSAPPRRPWCQSIPPFFFFCDAFVLGPSPSCRPCLPPTPPSPSPPPGFPQGGGPGHAARVHAGGLPPQGGPHTGLRPRDAGIDEAKGEEGGRAHHPLRGAHVPAQDPLPRAGCQGTEMCFFFMWLCRVCACVWKGIVVFELSLVVVASRT